ncbi:MAG: hypothetical protein M1483_01035 [Actinobacteria bacterium]|nr:hypothetical protein [Actinomycetota bacterium]
MKNKGSASVYVKAIPCEEGTRVLCLSEGRAAKEHSMDEAHRARFFSSSFQIERTHRGGQAQK